MTPKRFRQLLVGNWIVGLFGCALSIATDSRLPPTVRAFQEAQLDAMPIWQVVAGLLYLILSLWNTYELYNFRARARQVYQGLLASCLILVPFAGPYVDSGWGEPWYVLSSMICGALLLAMFTAPLSDRFQAARGAA